MVGKYNVITPCGSTRSEIAYTHSTGKNIRYLEDVTV